LQYIAMGLGTVATTVLSIPIIGYLFGTLIQPQPDQWIDLGEAGDFTEGQTRLRDFDLPKAQPWDGAAGRAACYVRREADDRFTIFAVNCAHLGCPVEWFPQSGLFMCPCHGGVYYENGDHASGPPPRGLFKYDYKVEADPKSQKAHLFIWGAHLPTLQDPLRKQGDKA